MSKSRLFFGWPIPTLLMEPLLFSVFGVLMLCTHMSGTILIHLVLVESFMLQTIVLLIIWLAVYLRNSKLVDLLKPY